jgi:catalase (peroxidase I)
LAPTFLKLAITDALGFDAQTTAGGPDGSVAFEMDRPENEGLKAALNACQAIQKDLKRTSEVSLSDVIAFAGGESLLAVGGPRIAVQLGRYDSKAANPAANIPGFSFEKPTSDGFKAAFKRSGLGGKEMALLLSAMGSVQDVVDIALKEKQEEEEDDLVDSSWEKNLPNSFGRPDEMYGARIGKADFGTSYITRILQKEKKNARDLNATDAALLSDQECRSYLLKYVGNEKAFGADVAEAYARLTLLGAAYESRMLSRE